MVGSSASCSPRACASSRRSTPPAAAAMAEIAAFGGLLIAHAEDPAWSPRPRPPTAAATRTSWPPARPRPRAGHRGAAGADPADRLPDAHRAPGRAARSRSRAAAADGLPVTAETCPHYLTLPPRKSPTARPQFKCCPPIRGAATARRCGPGCRTGDRLRRLRPLAVPGGGKRLDTGDFGAAWGGIASVQLGLPAVWTEARPARHRWTEVAGWMAAAPAALTGLADRGAIRPGLRADLCCFAPDEKFVVDPARAAAPPPGHPVRRAGADAAWSGRPGWPGGGPEQGSQPGPRGPGSWPAPRREIVSACAGGLHRAARPGQPGPGRDGDLRQRRVLRGRGPPDRPRPGGDDPAASGPRQGVRRLGDPPPPRARHRLRHRPAGRARDRPGRQHRHRALSRQLPAVRLGRRRHAARLPRAGRGAGRAPGPRWRARPISG